MEDNLHKVISRRSLLRRGACGALGLTGLTSQMFTMRATAAMLNGMGFPDHKALVCIFLFGGNDSGNTLIPIDGGDDNYTDYAAIRAQLALPRESLDPTIITPSNTGGRRFALHPSLQGLKALFDQQSLAVVANVGTLVYPMTRDDYYNDTVQKPASLFAHNIQQQQWQVSTADATDRLGWGGRIADALQSAGANPAGNVSMNVSLAGNNFFQTGREISPFVMTPNGVQDFTFYGLANTSNLRDVLSTAHADLMAAQCEPNYPDPQMMQKVYADVIAQARVSNELVGSLLDTTAITTSPPPENYLASQLHMIARMIEQRSGLGHNRQIFFCAVGGYDNHDGLVGTQGEHAGLLAQLDEAMTYFWGVLGQLGIRDQVTTFTASDFGRTMVSNSDGSDHGWGGHHFVMGGSQVAGGKLYGTYPVLSVEGPDDTNRGRYIPTTSVDSFSFELARWMGVPAADVSTVFPNLTRFLDVNNPATHLGIMR